MTDYIQDFQGVGLFKKEADRIAEQIKTDTVLKGGVLRWKMGNLVPQDVAEFAKFLGVAVDLKKQAAAFKNAVGKLVRAMIDVEAKETDEERAEREYEMRAVFGPGETVVNIFTGKRYKT